MFSKQERVASIVNNDNSGFFASMTPADLSARNVSKVQDYKNRYVYSSKPFSAAEQHVLSAKSREIDEICSVFPGKRLASIPWKFVKLAPVVENGFPHTMDDTIFLPERLFRLGDASMTKTMLHEKIHVYQRAYPLSTNVLICEYWGYEVAGLRSAYPLARNNPDITPVLYARHGHATPCVQFYNSERPDDLADSYVHPDCGEKYEHPYEQMAYVIADAILYGANDEDSVQALRWARTYL